MSRRTTSDDEKKLFRKAVDATRPQVIGKVKAKKTPRSQPGGSGLDGNTRERLKRGALAPQARIDLHGHTEAAAHRVLLGFLQQAQKNNARLVLVITGKGNPPEADGAAWTMRDHGVLKQMVPRWLNEPDFAVLTAGSAPAHVRHGGGGALYVYLRKPA